VQPAPENSLEFAGNGWAITYAGKTARFRNLDGLLYMSYLLERPGPEGVRLLDIEMLVNARLEPDDEESDQANRQDAEALLVSAGFEDEEPDEEMLRSINYSNATSTEDRETLEGYRFALKDLKQELGEAQSRSDRDHARYVQAQIKEITAELRQVEQRTKRGPENEGPSKGHIARIRNAINYAKDTTIAKSLPELAEHLQQYLVCESNTAVYSPPFPLHWSVRRPE